MEYIHKLIDFFLTNWSMVYFDQHQKEWGGGTTASVKIAPFSIIGMLIQLF